MTIKEHLAKQPLDEELGRDSNGCEYMKDSAIKNALDDIFDSWDTTYFKFDIEDLGKNKIAVSVCTLELKYMVREEYQKEGKTLTAVKEKVIIRKGAVTFDPNRLRDGVDASNYALANCIADAARSLGKRFGRDLNSGKKVLISCSELFYVPKKIAGLAERQQRDNAIRKADKKEVDRLEEQYDFKTDHA